MYINAGRMLNDSTKEVTINQSISLFDTNVTTSSNTIRVLDDEIGILRYKLI